MKHSTKRGDMSDSPEHGPGVGPHQIWHGVIGLLRRPRLKKRYWRMIAALRAINPSALDDDAAKRSFLPWLHSKLHSRGPLVDGLPWLPFQAIERLVHLSTRSARVFEYGAGGSTIFFSNRVAELVSVEHDRGWYEATKKAMEVRATGSGFLWRPLLVEPRPIAPGAPLPSPEDLRSYGSSGEAFREHSFQDYVRTIDRFGDAYFDLILIDGRSRPSCFLHAIRKVRPGGMIVLDNAERPSYRAVETLARESRFKVSEVWGPGPYNDYCLLENNLSSESGRVILCSRNPSKA